MFTILVLKCPSPQKWTFRITEHNMLLIFSMGFWVCRIGTSSTDECAGAHIKGLYHHQYNFWQKMFTFI
jgi:hypothetical protein